MNFFKRVILVAAVVCLLAAAPRAQQSRSPLDHSCDESEASQKNARSSKSDAPFYKQKKFYIGKAVYYFTTYKDWSSTKAAINHGACEGTRFLIAEDGCSIRSGRYWLTNIARDLALTPFEQRFGWVTLSFRLTLAGAHTRAWIHNDTLLR